MDKNLEKSKSKKVLVTVIVVLIIVGAIGFVGYHYFFLRKPAMRSGNLGANMGSFDRGQIGDPDQICEMLAENSGDIPNIGGRNGGDRMSKMEEFCADGIIDDSERAQLEDMKSSFPRPGR